MRFPPTPMNVYLLMNKTMFKITNKYTQLQMGVLHNYAFYFAQNTYDTDSQKLLIKTILRNKIYTKIIGIHS